MNPRQVGRSCGPTRVTGGSDPGQQAAIFGREVLQALTHPLRSPSGDRYSLTSAEIVAERNGDGGSAAPSCSSFCAAGPTRATPAGSKCAATWTVGDHDGPSMVCQPGAWDHCAVSGGPTGGPLARQAIRRPVSDPIPSSVSGGTWCRAPTAEASCTTCGTGNTSGTVTIPAGGSVVYPVTGNVVVGTTDNIVTAALGDAAHRVRGRTVRSRSRLLGNGTRFVPHHRKASQPDHAHCGWPDCHVLLPAGQHWWFDPDRCLKRGRHNNAIATSGTEPSSPSATSPPLPTTAAAAPVTYPVFATANEFVGDDLAVVAGRGGVLHHAQGLEPGGGKAAGRRPARKPNMSTTGYPSDRTTRSILGSQPGRTATAWAPMTLGPLKWKAPCPPMVNPPYSGGFR